MVKGKIMFAVFVFLLLPAVAQAAVTVSLQQTDRDPGSVIAGKAFTVSATGWSESCSSALIDLSGCSACSIDESTSKSISGSTVSWTTLMATQTEATQEITVSVSGTCSPDSGDVAFIAKSAPIISDSVSPTSVSVTQGGSFTLSLNILNSGETTARGTISISPSHFSISNCPFTPIPGEQSLGMNCEISASSSATTGLQDATLTITTTQGNELTKTVSVTVSSSGGPNGNGDGTTPPGGGGTGGDDDNVSNETVGGTVITIPNTPAGETANLTVDETTLAITGIVIHAQNAVTNATLTITREDQRPAEVTEDATGTVYQYLKIDKENITDDDIANATITFRVPLSWIAANNINESTIVLSRYQGAWNILNTLKTYENGEFAFFEVVSPGLSVFAISGGVITAPECPQCLNPTAWSTCTSGMQTRTNYRCSAGTGYVCEPFTEERTCEGGAGLTLQDLYIWIILIIVIIVVAALVLGRGKLKRKKKSPWTFPK